MTAEDSHGNVVTGFDGGVALTSSDGQAVIMLSQPVFVNGTAEVPVMLTTADSVTLSATWETIDGRSGAIAVGPAATTSDWFSRNMPDLALQDLSRWDFNRDGSLTYGDMLNLFAEVESAGPVTNAELTSLEAMVTAGGAAAVEMSAAVQDLAYKVVHGDPNNAWLQGESLGNLAVGSTPTQLQGLVQKWFQGADLPMLDLVGVGSAYAGYQVASGSLFGSGGPNYKDVYQGEIGDCWLIASFAETAAVEPSVIQSMFTDDGTAVNNGVPVHVWTVRFYENGATTYLTVDSELPSYVQDYFVYASGGQDFPDSLTNASNVLWVPLLEKAYAQLNVNPLTGVPWPAGNMCGYGSVDGGFSGPALPNITGGNQAPYNFGSASSFIGAIFLGDPADSRLFRRRELGAGHRR